MQMYLHKAKNFYFVGILSATDENKQDPDRVNQWYGSPDPDPYENVTDSQHC